MHNFNFTDETFDISQSKNYFLSMESSLDGFTYAISDMIRNKCIMLKHFSSESTNWNNYNDFLRQILESDTVLSASFKVVHHTLVGQVFAIIPEPFVSNDERILGKFLPESANQQDQVVRTESEIAKSSVICTYPPSLVSLLKAKFSHIKLSHHSLPFINKLITDSIRSLRYVFHLLVQKDYILLGVAHSGSLDFINTFKASSAEDIVYYTLTILEKFKVSPGTAEVYMINETKEPEIAVKLQEYIGRVKELKAPHNIVYSYVISEEAQDRFCNILSVYNCE